MNIEPDIKVIETIIFGTFAAIGGGLSYIIRTLNKDETPRLLRGTVEALSSAFVGLIAMLACQELGLNYGWSGVVVGVFGWLGAEASIVVLAKLVRNKLGLSNDSINSKGQP